MAMIIRHRLFRIRSGQQGGMTLIELMIAMVVLAVGIVGSMALIIRAISGDAWSKQVSNSTAMAQTVLERIMAQPANNNGNVIITDCTNTNFTVATAPGGPALNSNGDVDFTAAVVANYQMLYTDCDTNGHQAIYDVRWNVQTIPNSGFVKLLTVSSQLKSAGKNQMIFAPVTSLHTIVGQGT